MERGLARIRNGVVSGVLYRRRAVDWLVRYCIHFSDIIDRDSVKGL